MEDKTLDQNQVTEEEKKLSARIVELDDKEEKSEEELKELEDAKKERHSSFDKRIGSLTYRAKTAEEALAAKDEEIRLLKEKKAEAPKEPAIVKVSRETISVGEDKFHTDKALKTMLQAGEITEDEAYSHQQTRLKKEAAEEAYQRIRTEDKREKENNTRKNDAKDVLEKYPQFDKTSEKYDPTDPLLKEATRIFETGYYANPKGMSMAIAEAKKILRDTGGRIDNSETFGLKSPSAPGKTEKEIEFTPEEEDNAIRFYRDTMNPATGRNYTAVESIAKAKKAKTNRRIV